MKYKLVDYTTETQEDVTLGTCDLCMSTGHTIDFPYFHIQDETGEVHEIPGFMWSWGDLFDIYIENIPHFAAWLEKQDIQEPNYRDYDYSWLQTVVYKYDEHLDEIEDLLPWLEKNAVVEGDTIRLPFDDESKYYLINYSMDQVLKMLGFHVGVTIEIDLLTTTEDCKLYHAVGNDTVSFSENISYTDIDWSMEDDIIELYFAQYDKNGVYEDCQEKPLSDSFGEIIIVLHGDDVPDVMFE